VSGFRRLHEEPLFQGTVVSGGRALIEAPDGTRYEREVVHHPGAVVVVPVTMAGTVAILVRQYRAAVDRELLELPAGKRDVDGEAPELTAARELEEEIGMRARSLRKLVEFFNTPGFCDEHTTVYLATDLEPCESRAHGVEEEHMTVEPVALAEVDALVDAGEICDAKTIIGLCLARRVLAR